MEQTNDLESFIPGEFLARDSLPVTFVIFPKSREQEMDKTVARELGKGNRAFLRPVHPDERPAPLRTRFQLSSSSCSTTP